MERVIPPGHASMRQTEMGDQFDKTLFAALDAMEAKQIPFAMIGGIAASALSRPRSTHDIDLFVRPEDADAALEALKAAGLETEKTDPRWLYKAWNGEMMVDIIFKSQGDIYFDDEMSQRSRKIEYHGRSVPAVAPEDLVVIKCAVANEGGPHHWHDALAILSHANVDWSYLLKRSRKASRRVLSALIYAQSNDIWIPNSVIQHLFQSLFSESTNIASSLQSTFTAPANSYPQSTESPSASPGVVPAPMVPGATGSYISEKLREAIAQDPRTAALDIKVFVSGQHKIVTKGEIHDEDHRAAIEDVIRDHCVGFEIDNQVQLCKFSEPTVEEVV